MPPVFVVDARLSSEVKHRFAMFQQGVEQVLADGELRPDARAERLRTLGVPLSEPSAAALSAPGRANRVLTDMGAWLNDIYESGVVEEKQADRVQGYTSFTLREGETESMRAVSLVYDRSPGARSRRRSRAQRLWKRLAQPAR